MPTALALLLVAVVAAGVAGCRSGVPITWNSAPPTVPAGVEDARARFREIFCEVRATRGAAAPLTGDRPCDEALVRLSDEPPVTGARVATTSSPARRRIVVVPGLFSECIAPWITPFEDSLPRLEALGYRTDLIRVSGTATSTANAQHVRDALLSLADLGPDERVVVLGYSKGAVDVLEALATFPELAPRVAALVSIAGPIAGSPIADGLARWQRAVIETVASPFCGGGRGAIGSLQREERRAFLARVRLPPTVRYFSVIAMVEEPEVSRGLLPPYRDLALVDAHNDGQVVAEDAFIPASVLLGYVRADHWAIALPVARRTGLFGWLARRVVDRNEYPRELLLEAIVRAVEERL